MSTPARILAFAGSLRKDSYNKKLVRIAAKAAGNAGAEVTVIDLADFPLPVFDEDIEKEKGLPDEAKALKKLFMEHDALLIAAPEYNSSITAALKNAIDWVSRSEGKDEAPLACFAGKSAALLAASPGALGGLRGLVHVRAILGNIQVTVLPDQVAIPKAHEEFDDDGALKNDALRKKVEGIGAKLAAVSAKLKG
jgi:chromate reductase